MQCPLLGRVPSIVGGDLTIKATHTGITLLTERKYRKRYVGSKQAAVAINGELFLSAKELDEEIKQSAERFSKGKKKSRCVPTCLNISNENKTGQISDIFEQDAKKERKKSYSINKVEIRQRIMGYLNTQKGKKELYFWTISFPAGTPDAVCYQAFNTWLTSLRKKRQRKDGTFYRAMLRDYLWIAERQTGERKTSGAPTNTLHFHIAIPHWMDVVRANAMMRGTLKNLARAGALPGYTQQSYQIIKYNGVDISKNRYTRRITNFAERKAGRALAGYLSKYVTKNNAGAPNENGEIELPGFEHLAWHNSRGFSCLFTGVTFTIQEFIDLGFAHLLNRVRVFKMNFAKFVPWLYGPPPLLMNHLFKLNSYIQTCSDGNN